MPLSKALRERLAVERAERALAEDHRRSFKVSEAREAARSPLPPPIKRKSMTEVCYQEGYFYGLNAEPMPSWWTFRRLMKPAERDAWKRGYRAGAAHMKRFLSGNRKKKGW